MKRDRNAEQEQALLSAEAGLRQVLRDILPSVAVSGAPLFLNSRYNPLHFRPLEEAEALFERALACVEQRETLGLPVAGSVGRRFIEACEEAASANEQRRGPRKLAAWLFDAIE